jgi:hypothetical protein
MVTEPSRVGRELPGSSRAHQHATFTSTWSAEHRPTRSCWSARELRGANTPEIAPQALGSVASSRSRGSSTPTCTVSPDTTFACAEQSSAPRGLRQWGTRREYASLRGTTVDPESWDKPAPQRHTARLRRQGNRRRTRPSAARPDHLVLVDPTAHLTLGQAFLAAGPMRHQSGTSRSNLSPTRGRRLPPGSAPADSPPRSPAPYNSSTRRRNPRSSRKSASDCRCSSQATQTFSRSGKWIFGLFQTRAYSAGARQSLAEQTTSSVIRCARLPAGPRRAGTEVRCRPSHVGGP